MLSSTTLLDSRMENKGKRLGKSWSSDMARSCHIIATLKLAYLFSSLYFSSSLLSPSFLQPKPPSSTLPLLTKISPNPPISSQITSISLTKIIPYKNFSPTSSLSSSSSTYFLSPKPSPPFLRLKVIDKENLLVNPILTHV